VLVVDGDDGDRASARAALEQGGLTVVDDCRTPEQAAEVVGRRAADCVVVDYDLGTGDPRSVIEACRAADVPVVVLTDHGGEELAVELMKLGAADYLVKGHASPQRLARAVRGAVRVGAAERSEREVRQQLVRQAGLLARLSDAALRVHAAVSADDISAEGIARVAVEEALLLADAGAAGCDLVPQPLVREGLSCRVTAEGDAGLDLARADDPLSEDGRTMDVRRVVGSGGRPSLVRVALRGGGRRLGELWVARAARPFDGHAEALLRQLGQTVSLALRNAELIHDSREAAQARDDMLAIVSHDLRNPLNTITMGAAMLRQRLSSTPGGATEELAILDRVERGLGRMGKLLEDLLDASRIDAGRLAVSPERVRGVTLISEAVEAISPHAQARGIDLVAGLTDATLDVLADRHRVLQIFTNLVGNALKFTPRGGRVVLALEACSPYARFSVADTGPGIPPEQHGHLFKRFWKAKEGTREGAGLGLFISRGIAEAHGGAIGVDSRVGDGTRVWFTLPLA
jgi:signal transduction histidine kinase